MCLNFILFEREIFCFYLCGFELGMKGVARGVVAIQPKLEFSLVSSLVYTRLVSLPFDKYKNGCEITHGTSNKIMWIMVRRGGGGYKT